MTSYSYLSATNGSTFVARRAGMKQANNATTIKTIEEMPKVIRSVGATANRRLLIKRVTLLLQPTRSLTYQRQLHSPGPSSNAGCVEALRRVRDECQFLSSVARLNRRSLHKPGSQQCRCRKDPINSTLNLRAATRAARNWCMGLTRSRNINVHVSSSLRTVEQGPQVLSRAYDRLRLFAMNGTADFGACGMGP